MDVNTKKRLGKAIRILRWLVPVAVVAGAIGFRMIADDEARVW